MMLLPLRQSLVQGSRRLDKCGFHFLACIFPSLLLGKFPVDRLLMMFFLTDVEADPKTILVLGTNRIGT
jgi:hypothetical protein